MSMMVDAFVPNLLDGLAALMKDEVAMLSGVTDEIKRLQENLEAINAVVADAERKKIQDQAIDNWLKKLKDVVYDADDILDECWIEAEKSKAAASSGPQPSSSSSSFWTSACGHFHLFPCSCFGKIAFAHQIGRRIQGLDHRLEDILAERSNLDLQLSSTSRDDHRSTSRVSRKTSSIAEPDIVGSNIEKNTRKLVELLIKEDTRENILVYAIVGICGIDNTTLARRIFNDDGITASFAMKLWVRVSRDFEETSLLEDIITRAEGYPRGNYRLPRGDYRFPRGDYSRAQLETKVQNTVRNKKFLLVLDDLWDPKVWDDLLRHPLRSGATGSRVLVTTRNETVASQMNAVAPHHKVELLSDDGWALLCKMVGLSEEEGEIQDLEDIGKEIVDKCGGLPLAIKAIGGVLSTKSRNKKDWEDVLKTLSTNAWTGLPEEVQPALYLSYEDLPSQLKQCFLYCSLIPEDYPINRGKLINYWISEGFIHEEGDLTLEELGEDYYGDLVQRNFLQPRPWYDDLGCTVHDLLWSLARFLAGDENLVVKEGVEVLNTSSSVKPRRLRGYVTAEKCQAFVDALDGHNSLRTLRLRLKGSQWGENDVNNLIKKTPRLRVLDLSMYPIIKWPDSLGNLVHLRYLDLKNSQMSELPESIGNLVNLQFLILDGCKNLRSLPKGIGKLHNLRCLHLDGAELEGIPIEIANLHRLNTLRNFVVRNDSSNSGWCTLEELRSLAKLKVLRIRHLERALIEGEVGRVNALRDMLQLQKLHLGCYGDSMYVLMHYQHNYSEEETKRFAEIFEVTLCPPSPSRLVSLTIDGFFGYHLPSWIASNSTDSLLPGLRRLELSTCVTCPQLPPLGKLPNLDFLRISAAYAVKKIGTEFLGQEPDCSRDQGGSRIQISFPKLTTLEFHDMRNWEKWEWEVKDDDRLIALPNLKELSLTFCPKLRSLPSGLVHHATALTKLRIRYCDGLKAIRGFSSVEELEIGNGCFREGVSELPRLKTLKLDDDKMRSLPEWLQGRQHGFPALNKVEIVASDQLLRRCLKDGLYWPKIEHIPYVYATNRERSRYISKSPSAFSTNLNNYVEDE